MTIAALILAAGASTRMGRSKPLLPWGGTNLLGWELTQLMDSCVDDIVIVTGAHSDAVRRSLGDGARYVIFNQRWSQGRATSLVAGARALAAPGRAAPEVIVIQNVDQPTRADIVQPTYRGKSGHPVVLTGRLLPELLAVREDTFGLRAVVDAHPPRLVPMDDEPVVRIDLDTPDLLDEARQLLGVAG